jgi:hypothetical protein
MEEPLIGVKEAASRMGIAFQTLEKALIDHVYPFGEAVYCKRYRYIIIRARFEAYMNAQDMVQNF